MSQHVLHEITNRRKTNLKNQIIRNMMRRLDTRFDRGAKKTKRQMNDIFEHVVRLFYYNSDK